MKISRLEKIDPRTIWKGEASDFTPWLAKVDNIELLSETIGLDLELVGEERSVGPFRADILCKNTIDDTYVLIENQLEKTDHTHLGQLMTYAAGLDAVSIVWIARTFTEEHRAALDWLNRITNQNVQFFGIELEVFKIEESNPAPMFQLVSKPNDWTKSVKNSASQANLTETKSFYQEYWTAMKDYFEEHNAKPKCQKPQPQHWTNFAVGRSEMKLAVAASQRDNFIRIEFNLEGVNATDRFNQLIDKYEDESKALISPNLVWDVLPERQMSTVYLKKEADINNRGQWEDQFSWIEENLTKMDDFFRTRVKQIV